MKRIKLVLISSVIALFMASSCEDAYNIIQPGEFNDANLKTLDDLQAYLNAGVYGSATISPEIGFTGIFTDETGVGRGNGGQNLTTHRFFLNSDDGFAFSIWYGSYETINRVNRVLRMTKDPDAEGPELAQIPAPTDPTELTQYNSILAEARALRAFSYLRLLTYFSPDMSNDNALGVMYVGDKVAEASDRFPRVANAEIFTAMEADMDFAYANVATTDYKHVTKNMINAMRARFYLYRKNYTLAKQYAQDVIANAGVALTVATPVPTPAPTNPNYTVYVASNPSSLGAPTSAWNNSFYGTSSTNPYRKMWADASGSQGEIIFALDRPASGSWENVASNFTTNTTSASGSPLYEVSRSLFNELRSVPGDVRRYANVDPTSVINQNYDQPGVDYIATDVLVIDKYPGKPSFPLRNDLKVFRLSEMYFILAECLVHEGTLNGGTNTDSAASIIKKIRDSRNFLGTQPLPVYADATAALTDILYERRKELCFEAHRYIDIKRLGPVTGKSIERHFTDDQIQGAELTIPNNDYRFTMPIPRAELNANGSIEQNQGY